MAKIEQNQDKKSKNLPSTAFEWSLYVSLLGTTKSKFVWTNAMLQLNVNWKYRPYVFYDMKWSLKPWEYN